MTRRGVWGTVATAVTCLLLLRSSPDLGAAQTTPRSPRNASYTLKASLDPATHSITGSGTLTWRNITRTPATELQFHLYWNAWRDQKSTWMKEMLLAGNNALARRPAADLSNIELTKLGVAGTNLIERTKFIAPDDGNADDRTVLSVALDRPVAPGESVTVDLGWTGTVPRTFARTGRIGSYCFVAQWFPKVGVWTEAGW